MTDSKYAGASMSEESLKRVISSTDDDHAEYSQPKKINIVTSPVAAALDRTNTSSRNATYIIAAVARSLGHDVNSINLSCSAIHRKRSRHRARTTKGLKESLQTADCLIAHWDGKMLPDIVGKGTVERLPVIVTGLETEQLLGVPKIIRGTGANQAAAVVHLLNEWNISDRVRGICFDTTASNTGKY